MMRGRLVTAVVLLMMVGRGAQADEAAKKRAEAKLHYEAGDRAFRLGDFDRAISEFKASYDLSGVPLLLYNVAQAYRQKGDNKQALFFYQQYLAAGGGDDPESRRVAEKRVEELKVAIEKQQKAQEAPPIGTTPPAINSPHVEHQFFTRGPNDRELRHARTLKVAGYATGGFGVLALGLGGAFVGLASNENGHIVQGATWNPGNEDKRNTYEALDATFFAVGGVALAAGLTLYLVGRHQENRTYRYERTITITAANTSAGGL
jgi:tetratricopeptide (TPR) repeat protein